MQVNNPLADNELSILHPGAAYMAVPAFLRENQKFTMRHL